MMVSPVVVVPVILSVLFSRPIFFFFLRISVYVSRHWPLTL